MVNIKNLAFLGAKKRLYLACSKIHLSVDYGKINTNNKAVIVVVACFLSEDSKLQKITLKLVKIIRRYTSKLLAKYIMATIVK